MNFDYGYYRGDGIRGEAFERFANLTAIALLELLQVLALGLPNISL